MLARITKIYFHMKGETHSVPLQYASYRFDGQPKDPVNDVALTLSGIVLV
jgi:hypothetical protein